MEAKGIVDVPPWMLVESTGDSEVDSRVVGHASDCDDDEDDAQSCICGESEDLDPDSLRELRRRFDVVDEDEKAWLHVQQQQQEEEEEEEEVVRGCLRNCGGEEQKGVVGIPIMCHKSSASVDSTEEEKNRLFWEACLAS